MKYVVVFDYFKHNAGYFFGRNRSARSLDSIETRIVSIPTILSFGELAVFLIARETPRNPKFTSRRFMNFHGAIRCECELLPGLFPPGAFRAREMDCRVPHYWDGDCFKVGQ